MKYFHPVVPRGAAHTPLRRRVVTDDWQDILEPTEAQEPARLERSRRGGMRSPRQHRKDAVDDLRAFHPFRGGMPRSEAELAEEIGARLTVLAVRTHVPRRGRPRPEVTLRMRHALRMLARAGGQLSVSGLANKIGTGVPAASQMAGRLQRRGFVAKESGGMDRRMRTLVLTVEGWRRVPMDERLVRDDRFAGMLIDGGRGELVAAPAPRVRRRRQAPSPVEEGLRSSGVRPRELLAGLRGVLATMYGFDVGIWEEDFRIAVWMRQRWPRNRHEERWAIAALPRPRYQV